MANILVIDDEQIVRELLKNILGKKGYQVFLAENGKKAREIFNTTPIDVIITDIFMPEKDGLEIIMEMKRSYNGVKIIAISGGGPRKNIEILKIARELGAHRVIEKPFQIEEMINTVEEVLKIEDDTIVFGELIREINLPAPFQDYTLQERYDKTNYLRIVALKTSEDIIDTGFVLKEDEELEDYIKEIVKILNTNPKSQE